MKTRYCHKKFTKGLTCESETLDGRCINGVMFNHCEYAKPYPVVGETKKSTKIVWARVKKDTEYSIEDILKVYQAEMERHSKELDKIICM